MFKFDFFGAKVKEPPQLTMARTVLGVSRKAENFEIKKAYRKLSIKYHPDRNPGDKKSEKRFKAVSSAYELLADPKKKKKADEEFSEALKQPFIIGHRVFSIGSLYGQRIYIPSIQRKPITNTRRLIGSGKYLEEIISEEQVKEPEIYSIRSCIMESQLADSLEIYYQENLPEESREEHFQAFMRRGEGGLDDLDWIRRNDVAICNFLHEDLKGAVSEFREVNKKAPGNIIFMYRFGVCIEAMVAKPGYKQKFPDKWIQNMGSAIKLYDSCLERLVKRKGSWYEGKTIKDNEEKIDARFVGNINPKSLLTVKMQLADAYFEIGEKRKSKEIWKEIQEIDPSCYEAEDRLRSSALRLGSTTLGKFAGLLSIGKKY